jgi:hypothetical protein
MSLSYFVHKTATDNGYYIKNRHGSDFDGWCWPGSSSYLDFTSYVPRATSDTIGQHRRVHCEEEEGAKHRRVFCEEEEGAGGGGGGAFAECR